MGSYMWLIIEVFFKWFLLGSHFGVFLVGGNIGVFQYNGTSLAKWGNGTLAGLPGGVTTDATGNVFVTSYSPAAIAVFDWKTGKQSNLNASPVVGPVGVSFGPSKQVIYVADGKDTNVAIFSCQH
jgi:DNA-binding beta-propeller fold protein YncE